MGACRNVLERPPCGSDGGSRAPKVGIAEILMDDGLWKLRASKGRPFSTSAINGVWAQARTLAFTPGQVLSPLAQTPYDLRHAAASLWLNAGVPAPEVAERAGHSVDVLLKVYAKCVDGQREIANQRIEAALTA